jgi:PAS domain S-box-containing protein
MHDEREKMAPGAFEMQRLCRYFSELSPQPMVAVEGKDHLVRFVNPAFTRLVGHDAAMLIGRSFRDAVPEGRSNTCEALLDRVLRTGESGLLEDQEHEQATPSRWTYLMWAITGDDRKPAGVMIQVSDVSNVVAHRKLVAETNQALLLSSLVQHERTESAEKLNSELTAATNAKSQFLANMRHEIRTPLGAVLGYAELMRDPGQSREERASFIDTIARNGRELALLVDDILDLSKVEAGQLEIERLALSVPSLLADVTESLAVKAREKGIRLSLRAEGSMPETIESDPTRLRQILLNVVGNAIKFTQKGGVEITVKLIDRGGPRVAFFVKDTGPGIAPAAQERLFQAFSQADASTTRKFGGTGLGLVLSRHLARALGGDIELVESVPDRGSTFLAFVEAGKVAPASLSPGGERPLGRAMPDETLEGVKVLLAEDSRDSQLLIQRVLRGKGARVELVGNGADAVRHALDDDYDLVLMDMQMPVLDGFDAARELRSRGYGRPIIALTAHAMREEREKSLRAGCNDHLAKPVDFKHLVHVVAHYAAEH